MNASGSNRVGYLFLASLGCFAETAAAQQPTKFFSITPCRVYDSRWGQGPLTGGFDRVVPIGGYCGIPSDATAVALNLTAVSPNAIGTLSAYPTGLSPTNTTAVAFAAGATRASNAVIKLGTAGQMSVVLPGPFSSQAGMIVDVSGYFRPAEPVQQWRRWEQTIISTVDYTASGGNPYSEIDLRVKFTNSATGNGFAQYAYWDSDDAAPRIFKVATALPAGNWTWQVWSCDREGVNCLGDGWNPSSGTIVVQSNLSSGVALFDAGFPRQREVRVGAETTFTQEIAYPTGAKFDWIADTAWTAPVREYDPPGAAGPQTAAWSAYVLDRQAKGFTAIQVAPAVEWPLAANPTDPCEDWLRSSPLPPATRAFRNPSGCPGANAGGFPYKCSKPNMDYWNHFDRMVGLANDADLTVAVIGVMNPTGIHRSQPYPTQASAAAFARFLAGRLGARNVIYSPSFDDFASQRPLIDFVGRALKKRIQNIPPPADPDAPPIKKDILTLHLAGGATTCTEYHDFAAVATPANRWLNSYLFQSGHGKNLPTGDTDCAVGGTSNSSAEFKAMGRARLMSLKLDAYGDAGTPADPELPAVNAEGPYDPEGVSWGAQCTDPPPSSADDRLGSRHAAYLNALSNGAGYGYGTWRLFWWRNPSGALNFDSARDIERLSDHFRGLTLEAKHGWRPVGAPVSTDGWILNQHAEHDKKLVLATAGTDRIAAYLPAGQPQLVFDTASGGYANLTCSNTTDWTRTWVDPSGVLTQPIETNCSSASGSMFLTAPPCSGGGTNCDWLLKIRKTTAQWPNEAEAAAGSLEVWEEPTEGDRGSSIKATLRGTGRTVPASVVSTVGRAFQHSPNSAPIGPDALVVWQAEGLDGSLSGVYGSIVGPLGEVKVGPFQVNHYTEGDQREPAVAGSRTGEALVVWAGGGSHEGRGIFARVIRSIEDAWGDPRGEEVQVSAIAEGRVQNPRLASFPGGYWVAWEVAGDDGRITELRIRHLLRDGRPLGRELRIPVPAGEDVRILDLADASSGLVRARWWRLDRSGRFLGLQGQQARPSGLVGQATESAGQW